MLAAAMSATLSALTLFSRAEALFPFDDATKALKSALCFVIAAANSSLAAESAASMSVCLMELGEGGLEAMEANVSIPLTPSFPPSMVFVLVKTSRIEGPG